MKNQSSKFAVVMGVSALMAACSSNPPVQEPVQPIEPEVVVAEPVIEEVVEVAAPAPAPIPVPNVSVNFAFDSSEVALTEKEKLQAIVRYVQEAQPKQLIIKGHADETGPEMYNEKLSKKRAEAVKQQLEAMGLGTVDVELSALGETQPVASNATRTGREQNRRVEFTPITTALSE